MSAFFEFLSQLAIVSGLGLALDSMLTSSQKDHVSWYIFGFSDAKFGTFESETIRTLLSPFVFQDRLRPVRVFLFCLVVTSTIFLYSRLFLEADATTVFLKLNVWWAFSFVLAIISYPLDYTSFWITKKLFWARELSVLKSISFVFFDLLATFCIYTLVAVLLALLKNHLDGSMLVERDRNYLFYYAFAGSLVASASITLVQILSLISGSTLRLLIRVSYLNRWIALNSNVLMFPFTFLFISTAVFINLFSFANTILVTLNLR